jgi:hypothetical protein
MRELRRVTVVVDEPSDGQFLAGNIRMLKVMKHLSFLLLHPPYFRFPPSWASRI